MKYKYLSTFLLATTLISLSQGISAHGGKGEQIEDPFERTVYWQRKVKIFRENIKRQDLPKAERFKNNVLTLMKEMLTSQTIKDIENIASDESGKEKTWKASRAKYSFCEIYKEYRNEIDEDLQKLRELKKLQILQSVPIDTSSPLGSLAPLFTQIPLCNYFATFLDIQTMANWELTSKETRQKLLKLPDWKKIKSAQIPYGQDAPLPLRWETRKFMVQAYIAYHNKQGKTVYENIEKACALNDPEACQKKYYFLLSRFEGGGYKEDPQTPEDFLDKMLKTNHLWALKIKIENSPQDDSETGKMLKNYIEKGSAWAYETRFSQLKQKGDLAAKQEMRFMVMNGYIKIQSWGREKFFEGLLNGEKKYGFEQDREEALLFLEEEIFARRMWALKRKYKTLFNGLDGFDSDCVTAHELLDPYAKKGNSWALKKQYQMHMVMYNGDKIKAGELLEKGANQGYSWAIEQKYKNLMSSPNLSSSRRKEAYEFLEYWAKKEGNNWALNTLYWELLTPRETRKANPIAAYQLLTDWNFLPKLRKKEKASWKW